MLKPDKTWIELSSQALRHNLKTFQTRASPAKVMAVVKANAYGHGLRQVGEMLKGERDIWFGVDQLDEALQLRGLGIIQPILILGYTPRQRLKQVLAHDLSLVVYQRETLDRLAKLATKRQPARVHLKLETGTTRQGIDPQDLRSFFSPFRRHPTLILEGLSTHFANIEDRSHSRYPDRQLQTFQRLRDMVMRAGLAAQGSHAANSAAAVLFPDAYFSFVRLGISLYGYWPSEHVKNLAVDKSIKLQLKPVLTWKALVAQVKDVKAQTPIGYGLSERVRRQSKVAVIPIGYADGFDRYLSQRGQVLIRGQRCRVLGRVCMNMIMVDVTDIPQVKAEDEAVIIGRQGDATMSADDMAKDLQTISYEVLSRLNPLIPRRIISYPQDSIFHEVT